jgi:hypothetical protein
LVPDGFVTVLREHLATSDKKVQVRQRLAGRHDAVLVINFCSVQRREYIDCSMWGYANLAQRIEPFFVLAN